MSEQETNSLAKLFEIVKVLETMAKPRRKESSPYEIGSAYFIRTVTHHYTGKLVMVTRQELVLEEAAWIADDGRFAPFVRGNIEGAEVEIEPYPDGVRVIIGRGAVLDAVKWKAKLPRDQK